MKRIALIVCLLLSAAALYACSADSAKKVQTDAQFVSDTATNPLVQGAAGTVPGGASVLTVVGLIAGAVAATAGAIGTVYQAKQKNVAQADAATAHGTVAELSNAVATTVPDAAPAILGALTAGPLATVQAHLNSQGLSVTPATTAPNPSQAA